MNVKSPLPVDVHHSKTPSLNFPLVVIAAKTIIRETLSTITKLIFSFPFCVVGIKEANTAKVS